jgi:hypothetical protein
MLIGLGTIAFLASIVLYLVAVATPLPFGVKQQPLSLIAGLVKILESIYVVASLALIGGLSTKTLAS